MASEWAIKKTEKLVEQWDPTDSYFHLVSEALDAARAQGRREGLEEAAKVADAHEDHVGFEHDSQRDACVQFIAADIRALIAQEPV